MGELSEHQHTHTGTDFSKESVFLGQFVSSAEGDEELRSVVVGTCIGTPHEASPHKLESCVELILRE